MLSGLVFLFVLSVLVVVHEFGHFLMARWVGVRVEKFSIGFGPILFGKKFGQTEFCVSLLPLGGFVKLAGESVEEAQGHPWEFRSKTAGQKFWVVLAGPLMNAFLAFVLFWGIFLVGQPMLGARIGKVLPDAPASRAGMLEGDRLLEVNGQKVAYWEDILREVQKSQGTIRFRVERGGAVTELEVAPRRQSIRDIFGKEVSVAFVGVAPSQEVFFIRNGFLEAMRLAAERVWALTSLIFYSLWLMVTGALPFRESVTGPIGIFFLTQEAAKLGAVHLFYFMGSLSVSLFVLNLLPIPVLDGGHLLFMLIEKLTGSPLKESVRERMTQGGLALLLVLMAYVILQDVHRYSILEPLKSLFGGGRP